MRINKNNLAKMIDHTLLKPNATIQNISNICEEAIKYGFASVCVNPFYVSLASELLKTTEVKVCTVIGFPLGASTSETKAFEASNAVKNGAEELDMVINIGALKSGDYSLVKKDISAVVNSVKNKIVKVIIEACYLSKKEKIKVCELSRDAGAHFIKTSTGFGISGAKIEDVKLIRQVVARTMGVKAAGGIRSCIEALRMIEAGASRIGTSRGTKIIDEYSG